MGVEEGFHPNRKAHPGILVTSLQALAKRFEDNGVSVTWDDNFPGHDRFYVSDKLGNRLESLEPVRDRWRRRDQDVSFVQLSVRGLTPRPSRAASSSCGLSRAISESAASAIRDPEPPIAIA
ncbi:hypothetical protein GCM10009864_65310 [Streptomyces lunalinharesii]|uniref:VOC domain-containing protein n=1 Tax=Streptomyces lunalinharesii TaxID=333384 RepID=A0ABP6F4A0_9ACTN